MIMNELADNARRKDGINTDEVATPRPLLLPEGVPPPNSGIQAFSSLPISSCSYS